MEREGATYESSVIYFEQCKLIRKRLFNCLHFFPQLELLCTWQAKARGLRGRRGGLHVVQVQDGVLYWGLIRRTKWSQVLAQSRNMLTHRYRVYTR